LNYGFILRIGDYWTIASENIRHEAEQSHTPELEDALAILQSVSDSRYPLLADESLKIQFGLEAIDAWQAMTSDDESATTSKSQAGPSMHWVL